MRIPGQLFAWMLAFLVFAGCAGGTRNREPVDPVYKEMIREWQLRMQKEEWSEDLIHSILFQFRTIATYRTEAVDHWDTPKEFMRRGFSGDCEDIAVFMMWTLRKIGYPHKAKILIVGSVLGDHALLKIEMPEGGWKVYDVVPSGVPVRRPNLLRPIVEFDEKSVDWLRTASQSTDN